MPTFEGVVVYTIERNGCLNGIYTNNHPNTRQQVFNESARLPRGERINLEELDGTLVFDTTWIDLNNEIVNGRLEITSRANDYLVNWFYDNGGTYTGIGFLLRDDMFVVRYEE